MKGIGSENSYNLYLIFYFHNLNSYIISPFILNHVSQIINLMYSFILDHNVEP